MEPMLNGMDFLNVKEAQRETGSLMKETIIVSRFTSFTGGGTGGVSPTRNNNTIPMLARVHTVTSKDILNSGGLYQEGDVITDTEAATVGASTKKGAISQADIMTWNGLTYIVVGTPQPKNGAGGRVYTKTVWRRN